MTDLRVPHFLRCVYVILLLKDGKLTSEQRAVLKRSLPLASEFLRDHKLGSASWVKLFKKAIVSKKFESLSQELISVFDILKKKRLIYAEAHCFTNLQMSIVRDFRTYCKTDSIAAYARLEKSVGETGEPLLYGSFLPDEQDASVQIRALRRIVKEYEPTNSTLTLSINIAKELREDDPQQYKQYLAVKTAIRKAFKAELLALVRMSGKKLLDVRTVAKHMRSVKIPTPIQEGFVGQMDEAGNFYTRKGKTHPGRQLKTNPAGECFMNTEYDPDTDNTYVLKSETPGATQGPGLFYTKDFMATSSNQKYKKVSNNLHKFEKARSKWLKEMGGNSEKGLYAVLCEVSYLSMARIGSKNETISNKGKYAGKHTYGIRNLLCKHAKVYPDKIVLSYLGVKTSAQLKHFIYNDTPEGMKLYKILAKRIQTAEPKNHLFTFNGKIAAPTKLNAYIKSLGLGITVHKFRTVRGTLLFDKLAAASKVLSKTKYESKEILLEVDRLLEKVGKELGHFSTAADGSVKITGTTALQYYVLPDRVVDILQNRKIRPSAKIQKVIDDVARGKSN